MAGRRSPDPLVATVSELFLGRLIDNRWTPYDGHREPEKKGSGAQEHSRLSGTTA